MKGNAKYKNYRFLVFEPPFGDLGVMHRVHLWLDGKRIVNLLLAIINLFRKLSRLRQSLLISVFSRGVCHFERIFQLDGDVDRNPSMDRWIEE